MTAVWSSGSIGLIAGIAGLIAGLAGLFGSGLATAEYRIHRSRERRRHSRLYVLYPFVAGFGFGLAVAVGIIGLGLGISVAAGVVCGLGCAAVWWRKSPL